MMPHNRKESILNFIAWNANGLNPAKLLAFSDTMSKLRIDVALFSETHFAHESRGYVKGYRFYSARHPSNKARGGASVAVRENIKHSVINIIEEERFQVVIIQIESSLGPFSVAAIYAPPRHPCSADNYSDLLDKLGPRFLIGGDWNAKNVRWASRLTNTRGRQLEEAVSLIGGDFITPGKPTFYPADETKEPDLIDFFVFNNLSLNNKTVCSVLPGKKDHVPVTLSVFATPVLTKRPPCLISAQTDWKKFQSSLTSRIDNTTLINDRASLDKEVESLISHIQEAAKCSTPVARNNDNYFPRCTLPADILRLVDRKKHASRRKRTTFHGMDKNLYNRLNKAVEKRISEYRNKQFEKFITSLSASEANDYSLWKATKSLKRPFKISFPIHKTDGGWANNSQEKADTIAAHLENVFKPNPCSTPEKEQELSDAISDFQFLPDEKIKKITYEDIFNEIKYKTKIKKSPGFDLISAVILKQLPPAALKKMVTIFNAVISLKYIPLQWKKAEVIVLLKSGKPPSEPSSYRPISLLPLICKLFEKLYIKRLLVIVSKKRLLPDEQFGFRSEHSTVEQLHRISAFIDKALEQKHFCNVVFLDVAQAFDRVWHQKLAFKLSKMLPGNHVQLLMSYIADRFFRVRFEDSYSEFRPIRAGVPQGSVLSPLLYSLFTADIPKPKKGKLGIFADDTAVASSAPTYDETVVALQESLDDIQEWTGNDRTVLNATKSVNVVFTLRPYVHTPLVLKNTAIPHSCKAPYLGLIMDSRLNWKEHILTKKKQIEIKHRKMLWLLGKRSKLSLDNKILLYKSMIRPIWAYGSQMWACAAYSNLMLIERTQNKILRQMAGARWYERNTDIRGELGIEEMDTFISRLYNNYEERLGRHPNPEAMSLLDWVSNPRRLKRRKPHELATAHFRRC